MPADAPPLVIRVAANLDDLRKNLAEGVSQIETTSSALTRMAQSYDGSKIITQAGATVAAIGGVGNVTKLTAAEQAQANRILEEAIAKYQALGREVPPQMQAIADATKQVGHASAESGSMFASFLAGLTVERVVEKVIEFGKEALETASRLDDLSRATGISTDALQRMAYVGSAFGIDMETLGRGVEQFSARLAGGDAGAVRAVEMLGLSVKDLVASGPEEAFLAFTDAAGRIEDPMMRGSVAADALGGRIAKTLLPVMGQLREEMGKVPKEAIISPENVAAADSFDDALHHLSITLKAYTVDAVGWTAKFAGAVADVATYVTTGKNAYHEATAAVDGHTQATTENSAAQADQITTVDLLRNRLEALRSAGQEPLTASQQDAVKELKLYGVSLKEIADLTHTSEQAVTLYVAALKTEEEQAKRLDKLHAETAAELTKLKNAYDTLAAAQGGTANEQAVASINRQFGDLKANLLATGKFSAEVAAQLQADWDQALAGVGVDWSVFRTKSRDALQETADNALKTYNAMAASGAFGRAELELQLAKWHELQDAARDYGSAGVESSVDIAKSQAAAQAAIQKTEADARAAAAALRSMGNSMTYDLGSAEGIAKYKQLNPAAVVNWSDAQIEAFVQKGGTLAQLINQGIINPYANMGQGSNMTRTFDAGGPVVETGPAIHAGEYVVPKGGALVGGNGPTVNIAAGAIVLHYPIMNDPRARNAIADDVGAAVIRRLRDAGLRVPTGV